MLYADLYARTVLNLVRAGGIRMEVLLSRACGIWLNNETTPVPPRPGEIQKCGRGVGDLWAEHCRSGEPKVYSKGLILYPQAVKVQKC